MMNGERRFPKCEEGFPEDMVFSWDDLDFPVWVEFESYNDRDIEHTAFQVWFKVDESGSVEGPYDEKEGDLI